MDASSSAAVSNVQTSAGAREPGSAAVERTPLSAVFEAVQSQVPQSAERDRVLEALTHLASGPNQKVVRSLASQWGARRKVGKDNRGTADMRNEVEDTVRRSAMRLLEKEEVREEGARADAGEDYAIEHTSDAVVLTEPTTDATSAGSSSQKLAEDLGKRAAGEDCTPEESQMARQGKKRRLPEPETADKSVSEAADDVFLSLQAKPVVEAIAILDTLPAGQRVNQLRDLLLQWRAAADPVQGRKRPYLRQLAAQFGIPLSRNIREHQSILRAIGENFIARVSALRVLRPGTGSGVSATVAVKGCLPGTTEGISAAAAARGDGAGEPGFSGVGEPAFGGPGAAPDGTQMGKRKAKGPAGEDSCAEEPSGAASGAAGSNAAAGLGTVPQRSRRRRNSEATSHGARGEASIAGELIASRASEVPARAAASLERFMAHRIPDVQPYRVRSVRIKAVISSFFSKPLITAYANHWKTSPSLQGLSIALRC